MLWMKKDHASTAVKQGHPTTFKNIFSEKQILPRMFYYLRAAKKFYVAVPFMYNFWSLCNKFATIFSSLIFHISLQRLDYFS